MIGWDMYLNDVDYRHINSMAINTTDDNYHRELSKAVHYQPMPWHKKSRECTTTHSLVVRVTHKS